MELLHDSHIWVLISFLIFAVVAFRLGKGAFVGMLDNRIETIRKEIETAESLRVEAQELLAQYQRKQRDAEKEAKEIVATAKAHANEIKKQAEKELEEGMKRREQQLKERLARMEANALQEIQSHAAELAVKATKEIILEKMDQTANDRLVKESISQIASELK